MSGPPDWFSEPARAGFRQSFQVRGSITRHRSSYQDIEILDTVPFGRALVLDGALQTTEQDEFIYHESLAHVPLTAHPRPRRVLIIGGADGGCLRRVLQHPVERVVQVELDASVVEACRVHIPGIADGAYGDARVELVVEDGFSFVQRCRERFDALLVDSTDPVAPAARLFSAEFYVAASRCLAPEGLLATQSGSPLLMPRELRACLQAVRAALPLTRVYLATVPSYPGGLWSFVLASAGPDPAAVPIPTLAKRLTRLPEPPRYYTPHVHRAGFALPGYLTRWLASHSEEAGASQHPVRIEATG